MSMKARKWKQRKKKNDQMISFKKPFLRVSFSSCFSLAKSCHKVPMKLMSIRLVYSFYFLRRFAFRAYNAYDATLARSHTLPIM